MKLSTLILMVTFVLLLVIMLASNVVLKKEYDRIDKSDNYWTYGKILEQSFKHLKIVGGNLSNIAFEQNRHSSVRVLKNWGGYENNLVKAIVRNDTLFLDFPSDSKDPFEKRYMGWTTLVRVFSPELLSINGFDTNIELLKLKQKSITINLSGRSKLEVESYIYDFDSIRVTQRDSSRVIFGISPDLKPADDKAERADGSKSGPSVREVGTNGSLAIEIPIPGVKANSWETISVKSLDADLQGLSILDLGHARIDSLKLNISDSSSIILSGQGLRKYKD